MSAQPIQSRCVYTATAGGAGTFAEEAAFSPVSVLDWPLRSGSSELLRRASSDAAALQALRERLEADGRQVCAPVEHAHLPGKEAFIHCACIRVACASSWRAYGLFVPRAL